MLDLLIKKAEVFDGTGKEPEIVDVGVQNGRIASIGNSKDEEAIVEIDGRGLSLAPGFIDVHTHADIQQYVDPSRWCKLKQGVTTEIGGQCGWSPAPFSKNAPESWRNYITGSYKEPFFDTFKEAFEELDTRKIGTNQAWFVGHLYLRGAVSGMENRFLTQKEVDTMCGYAEEAMQSGAMGLSTGLVYAPGVYSSTAESLALAKTIGRYNGIYSTHMRNEGDSLVEAVQEAIQIAKSGDLQLNISHLKALFPQNYDKIDRVLEIIDYENSHGMKITFDAYPYTASSATILSTLPPSYMSHGMEWLLQHMEGKENIEALRKAIFESTEDWENPVAKIGFNNHLIVNALNTKDVIGMTIAEYAEKRNIEGIEAYAELIRLNEGKISDVRFAMSEDNIEKLYKHPVAMVGSDGLYMGKGTSAHVRAFSTFPRYLGRYIREKRVLPFAEGIRRLTGLPADTYNLYRKGYIREGYDADMVLFNKGTIIDKSTYADPMIPNEGIHMVFVNGKAAVVNNELTGVMEGKQILRAK